LEGRDVPEPEDFMTTRFSTCAAMLLALFAFSTSATAQTTATNSVPRFEVGGGYQWLDVNANESENTFPSGFAADAAKYYKGPFGLAGEVGWSHDSAEAFGNSVSSGYFHVGTGPRVAVPVGRVLPYGQFLIGYSRLSASATQNGVETEASANAFMFQFGGGATLRLGNSWGVFADLAYRHAYFDNASNEFKIYIGARALFN